MQSVSNSKLTYRSDIDGLRAIAVLAVIAYHCFPLRVQGGFVGVDIFFVISGFLISSIIYNELESRSFSIVEFYVRRIRRIYPALFIVMAAVCVAGWFILLPSSFVPVGRQIVGGSTFSANFVMWWQTGYFSPESRTQPLLHLWSLGVEEQYYLVFPLICIAFYKARSRWTLPAAFLVIAVVSMALNVAFVTRYSSATFFLPHARLWELFVGAGLSLCLHRNLQPAWEGALLEKWRTAIGFLGLGLIAVSIFGINKDDSFPGWWALLPTMGAALAIAAGPSSWCNRYILSCKPAVFVGLISYPLYLWHWPFLSFIRIASIFWGFEISSRMKGAAILLFFVLAYLTYRFVELPIRQVKQRNRRRRGALWLLGCVFLTGAFGVMVVLTGGLPARFPGAITALDHDFSVDVARTYRDGTCFLRADQLPASFRDDCLDPAEGNDVRPLVVLWGDSHAADLFPGFRALQGQSGVRLAQYTSGGCAPIVGLQSPGLPNCLSVNYAVLDRIKLLKPNIVVLSALWCDPANADRNCAARAEGLLNTIELVKAAGVQRIVVIGSAPFWKYGVPGLLLNELRSNPNNPVPDQLPQGFLEAHDDTLLKSVTQKAGAVYVPLFDDLCGQTSCIVTTGPGWQNVVTYDLSHFTEHGSIFVAQRIWKSIVQSDN
jgi:peptidoglycan/LPS O-acetylase OafA/YrhL